MPKEQQSNVDQWLKRETPRVRKALESASRYFDSNDTLTVNTLEAVYGQESSFGIRLGVRGSSKAAGHFQLKPDVAKQYGLSVSKNNDQRFDINYASSAAARYLKDIHSMFNKKTRLLEKIPLYESEFSEKSSADKNIKQKEPRTGRYRCTEGHWVTIDDRPVFICA